MYYSTYCKPGLYSPDGIDIPVFWRSRLRKDFWKDFPTHILYVSAGSIFSLPWALATFQISLHIDFSHIIVCISKLDYFSNADIFLHWQVLYMSMTFSEMVPILAQCAHDVLNLETTKCTSIIMHCHCVLVCAQIKWCLTDCEVISHHHVLRAHNESGKMMVIRGNEKGLLFSFKAPTVYSDGIGNWNYLWH